MPLPPLRLIVLARDQSPHVQEAWRELSDYLDTREGAEVVAAATCDDLEMDGLEADLVIVLGGDGAILRACRQLDRRQLPLMGLNLGRLGFLADLSPEEFCENFDTIRERNFSVVEHLMYEATIHRDDGSTHRCLGLNEVAILSGGSLRMIDVELDIDGAEVTTYSGDGVIISTPVGSTAHNLSAGGPILRQDLQAFVITPICPHTLTVRPVVDSADRVFSLRVPNAPDGVMVSIDGQIQQPFRGGDVIEIRRADATFQLARIPDHSFYGTLHRKLGWDGQPRYRRGPRDADGHVQRAGHDG